MGKHSNQVRTERLYMRLDPTEKARLQLAVGSYTYVGDFWRTFMDISAETLIRVRAGEIPEEELDAILGEKLVQFVKGTGILKEPIK